MHSPRTPRETAQAALREPVEQWIERHRTSAARLTYGQIARVLRVETGVDVRPETIRAWHADARQVEIPDQAAPPSDFVWPHHRTSDSGPLCPWSARQVEDPTSTSCPAGHEVAPVAVSPLIASGRAS